MPVAELLVEAAKAERYARSLPKHFARKVEVESAGGGNLVRFPMGTCHIEHAGQELRFRCEADAGDKLQTVIGIVSAHVLRLGELRGRTITWTHADGATQEIDASIFEQFSNRHDSKP
ncbi:MAG: DUF2218 domain-containing protein [Pseudomonadota bacterium]